MTEVEQSEKVEWRSECCKAHALGELSHEWWEINPTGERLTQVKAKLLREGLCSRCNEKANFVKV